MQFDRVRYKEEVERRAARSPWLRNLCLAYLIGGGICAGGQALLLLYQKAGLAAEDATVTVTVTLIALSALLTGLGIFDRIAKVAGAGTLVPVTGFANSVVSTAIDNKSEGLLMGIGPKIFVVAGPVILFGVLSGTLYGAVLTLLRALGWVG